MTAVATLLVAVSVSLATIFACVFVHYETLRLLSRATRRRTSNARRVLFVTIACLIAIHLSEIAIFGLAFFASVKWLSLGSFVDTHSMAAIDYFYYAAETYSSLGYGDIYPLGDIRLLASITPLIGILLLGWSSAFLFSLVQSNGET